MKPIEFVKVDARDGRPATEYPTRHGPADPVENITILWWEGRNPARYFGLVANDRQTDVPGVLREINAEVWAQLTAARRETLLGELAAHRFNVETGGVEMPDGTRVRTDRESQSQVNSAYTTLRDGMVDAADFKGANGWVTITLAEITPIATAVARHVQPCFTAERYVEGLLSAAETAEALHAIDYRGEFDTALEAIKAEQVEAAA
ncbi:DUF4376 domain-containing protein [Modicisalibacter radicis]|uniref:DUF4376 domain-containing protein n=1 Tax=Halomonas sp. EAR18 TaxID=2518972 RepID=UPI00109CD9B7|nr:DUF4376 domain-containing protein [Halomonas sp. EAR18]